MWSGSLSDPKVMRLRGCDGRAAKPPTARLSSHPPGPLSHRLQRCGIGSDSVASDRHPLALSALRMPLVTPPTDAQVLTVQPLCLQTVHVEATMAPNDNLRILGFGNPLLDISATVDQKEMDKWGVKPGDIILADEGGKHKPMYGELTKTHKVEYIAGGATQNSIRVAQWMNGTPGTTAFIGCIGKDAFGEQLESAAKADGVDVHYYKQDKVETGTCAVLVPAGGDRALIANLAAANCYDKAHFDSAPVQALLKSTKIVYCAGFPLTTPAGPPTIMAMGKELNESGKTFCMNLSAPFIIQVPPFKAALDAALAHVDFLFGNETEAATYGEVSGWGKDVATVALKLAAMPKACGSRPRVVVFTQGCDPTIVACGGTVSQFPVPKLDKKDLVDNGAGDAFVGGFLSRFHGRGPCHVRRGGQLRRAPDYPGLGLQDPSTPAAF